jgi:hypothetical protein
MAAFATQQSALLDPTFLASYQDSSRRNSAWLKALGPDVCSWLAS